MRVNQFSKLVGISRRLPTEHSRVSHVLTHVTRFLQWHPTDYSDFESCRATQHGRNRVTWPSIYGGLHCIVNWVVNMNINIRDFLSKHACFSQSINQSIEHSINRSAGQKWLQREASFYLLLHITTYYKALQCTNAYYYVLREYMVPTRLGPSLRRSVRARPVFRLFPVFRSKRETVKDGSLSKRDGDGRELEKKTGKNDTPSPEFREWFFWNFCFLLYIFEWTVKFSVDGSVQLRSQNILNQLIHSTITISVSVAVEQQTRIKCKRRLRSWRAACQ